MTCPCPLRTAKLTNNGRVTKVLIQICTFLYVVSVAKAFHHFVLHPEEHVDTDINSNEHVHDFNEDEFRDDMEHVHEHNDEAEDFLNVLNLLVSLCMLENCQRPCKGIKVDDFKSR